MRRGLDERTSFGNISNTSSSSSNFSTYPRRRTQFVDQVGVSSNSVLYLTWSGDSVDLKNLNESLNFTVKTNGLVSLRAILQLCQKYEAQEISVFLGTEDGSDYENTSHQYECIPHSQPPRPTSNLSQFSYSSDSSFEDDDLPEGGDRSREVVPHPVPQEPAEGIYGFMKQASKRMRKHWSLGKSLRRIRKMSVGATLPPPAEEQGPISNGSNTSLNRRRWSSFKSKFKPQLSTSGSVFYLDKEQSDTPDCIPNHYTPDKLQFTPPSLNSSPPQVTPPTLNSSFPPKPTPPSLNSSPPQVTPPTLNSSFPPKPIPPALNSSSPPQPSVTMATDTRRFSVAASSVRPTSPPPPPPPRHRQSLNEEQLLRRGMPEELALQKGMLKSEDETALRKGSIKSANSTWCSVESGGNEVAVEGGGGGRGEGGGEGEGGSTSWDYRTSELADLTSNHSSSLGSDLHLRFADEPLYQFYNETVTKEELNMCYSMHDGHRGSMPVDFDSDGYEEIGGDSRLVSRPSALDLITPRHGRHRTLWCEIPEVVNSEILKTLSKDARRLQEAKFELMTSEASYFKSLTVLEKHFASAPAFSDAAVLPAEQRKSLFGHIGGVRRCSERLLAALDACWQDSIMLCGVSEVVGAHASQHFHTYVTYCSNQIDLNTTLRRLKETNKRFEEELAKLESDPKCESLSLHSFLMLPMQRVTRMPLLMDAILSRLQPTHAEYHACHTALRTLNEFVQKCNEATRQQERVIEMVQLSRQLEFAREVRTLPIVSQSRWLVRSGQVLQLHSSAAETTAKQTFGRKFSRQGVKVTLFLFNDIMLLTKRKGEESYIVLDHCPRNLIQMAAEEDIANTLKYLIKVAMLKNHEGKLVEMIVSCESETSRQRWLQAMAPPTSDTPGESVYESWDCPQVVAIHVYRGTQPDELSIQRGDVINVLRKMADGWYYGERTRDGEKGWFPGNHAQEIISQHIRARNLQQRYRLLSMSGTFLELQKGNINNKKQK